MRKLTLLTLLLLPALAHAHPGHGTEAGFVAGALHPFTGLDHLLGVLTAGLLLGWLPEPRRWIACALFLGSLGATHVLWTSEAASSGFVPGLLIVTAALVATGMAATRLIGVTATAGR
jgi:urease accessory protein